ncbi:gephyrin-like molybdotransferase Glp [Sphingoaurantiacus capsulatus]|uniref:Molybdopterin molybdenumtransferase n=1 Tax=Sphingoaurantiacus capsulatus TaxID=1771310 RepID=A0ABV7XGP6_9SPHN
MLPLGDAQAKLLGSLSPLPAETVPLAAAAGRHLAADIVARRTQPPFAASAMDGYAIRFADMPGPWRLIGESSAGARFEGSIGAGETARIFTGAPLPAGADTVMVQEDVARDGDSVRLALEGPPREGAHIRAAGLDFGKGDRLVTAGTRLGAAQIGLIASGGFAEVAVHRRPRVALLSTGDELVPPGVTPRPDQIVNANGAMLAALFTAAGAEVTDLGIVADDRDAIGAALAEAAGADLLVTIGGASVGDRDLVVPVLEAQGAAIDFWKVAIRPGKPMLTGMLRATRVIGLPGNPVSAFVCAQLFVLPAIRRLAGSPSPLPPVLQARATIDLPPNDKRRDHLRATLAWSGNAWTITPVARQDSSMLGILAASNALLVRPENDAGVTVGGFVPVIPLDSGIPTP